MAGLNANVALEVSLVSGAQIGRRDAAIADALQDLELPQPGQGAVRVLNRPVGAVGRLTERVRGDVRSRCTRSCSPCPCSPSASGAGRCTAYWRSSRVGMSRSWPLIGFAPRAASGGASAVARRRVDAGARVDRLDHQRIAGRDEVLRVADHGRPVDVGPGLKPSSSADGYARDVLPGHADDRREDHELGRAPAANSGFWTVLSAARLDRGVGAARRRSARPGRGSRCRSGASDRSSGGSADRSRRRGGPFEHAGSAGHAGGSSRRTRGSRDRPGSSRTRSAAAAGGRADCCSGALEREVIRPAIDDRAVVLVAEDDDRDRRVGTQEIRALLEDHAVDALHGVATPLTTTTLWGGAGSTRKRYQLSSCDSKPQPASPAPSTMPESLASNVGRSESPGGDAFWSGSQYEEAEAVPGRDGASDRARAR